MSEKVAAVVVTYNRLELLKKVIDGLRNQTYKLDKIIVVNNASTDGTSQWLSSQGDLEFINQDNLGSSGGQYSGSVFAYQNGYDWIWQMDDDVVADKYCLENLFKFAEENLVKAIRIEDKLERYAAIDKVNEETLAHFAEKVFTKVVGDLTVIDEDTKKLYLKQVQKCLDDILYDEVRRDILVKAKNANIFYSRI